MGSLEKMTVTPFENDKFEGAGGQKFEVYINPESYSHSYKILYSQIKAPGSPGGSPKYNRTPSDVVKFELVFDGTGIIGSKIPGIIPGNTENVASQIQAFRKIVAVFNGKIHSPNFVQLSWGTLVFNGRLSAMDIKYVLFEPDGSPLRAKVNVTFLGFESEEALARIAKKKSPDLTHIVTVVEGDTLPLLCFKVYGDCNYYLQIAKINQLVDFRYLKPNTQLIFPPVKVA